MVPGGLNLGVGGFVGASKQDGESKFCSVGKVAHAETNWGLGDSLGGSVDYSGEPLWEGPPSFGSSGGAIRGGFGVGGMVGVGMGGTMTFATPAWGAW